ncbi:MAG: response regulator [Alphaproteobacteria bacterium]|nr:response regulator [Alphaproteobacteria bacterium]MBL6937705.1 response regulator [Alphaproteobacteria bacterium]MBL7099043.1 response regulator [Alphaproteobacteria bacterium]
MKNDRVVCIVDDDEAVRDSILVLLQAEGLAACAFASAAEFLSDATALSAACYILDVHMPGMDGVELLRHLRSNGVTVPIFLLTGRADPGLKRAALDAGANAVLNKPTAELVNLVVAALGQM